MGKQMWTMLSAGVLGAALSTAATAGDWPNYRGPHHDGAATGEDLAGYDGTPTKAWAADPGRGASSVAVVGDRLVTLGNKDDRDHVTCYDAKSGKVLWAFDYANDFSRRQFDGGTATTPAIDDGLVYTLSDRGHIHCLQLDDGSVLWKTHAGKFGGKLPRWHYAASPVVVGDLVVFNIGGDDNSTLALNKKTGEKVWGSGSDGASYGTPLPFEHDGKTFLAVAKAKRYVVLETDSGKQIAAIPWTTSYDVNSGTPTFTDGKLILSNGYGGGKVAMFDLEKGGQQVWSNPDFAAKYCSPVLYDGHLYGIAGERRGAMVCIRASDGKTIWTEGRYGNGTLTIVDGTIVALSENGNLVIGKADPAGFKTTVDLNVIAGRAWIEPVVSDGYVYLRNNKAELAAYKLR